MINIYIYIHVLALKLVNLYSLNEYKFTNFNANTCPESNNTLRFVIMLFLNKVNSYDKKKNQLCERIARLLTIYFRIKSITHICRGYGYGV